MNRIVIVLPAFTYHPCVSQPEIYRRMDDKGILYFSHQRPTPNHAEQVKLTINTY